MVVSTISSNDANNRNNGVNKAASAGQKQDALVEVGTAVAQNNGLSSKNNKIRPQQDIGNETQQAAKGSKGGPSLFSTWSGDALSLFMFNAAPLILQLNFTLRETLAKAQQTEAKNQIIAADASAQLREAQGEADANKLKLEANSSWAGGIMGLMGTAQGLAENFSANNVMENELDFQNKMISDLSTGSPKTANETAQARGVVQPAPGEAVEMEDFAASRAAKTPEELEEVAQKKANAKAQAVKLKENYENREDALKAEEKGSVAKAREAIGKSKWLGLGKTQNRIEHENQLANSQQAGKAAFDELSNDPDFARAMEDVANDPEVAAEFMKSLGAPDTAVNTLRGMPGEAREDLLKSFAKSDDAAALKQHLNNEQDKITVAARHERAVLDSAMQKRQIFSQAITGFTTAGSQNLHTSDVMTSAQAEAASQEWAALSSVMGAVRGAQDSAMAGSLQQVQGLMDWYSQMESQVIGAVAQSLA